MFTFITIYNILHLRRRFVKRHSPPRARMQLLPDGIGIISRSQSITKREVYCYVKERTIFT